MENCGRFVKWSRNLEFSGFGCGDLWSEFSSLFTDMRGYEYFQERMCSLSLNIF